MIHLAFVWHMHQPYYKDPSGNKFVMPWVRLHGAKDYLYMARLLEEFPKIKQTFNLVPSLLAQIEDYNNGVSDNILDATLKPAALLSREDKVFILWNFFMAHPDNMIKRYPRYGELLEKRGQYVSLGELDATAGTFSIQDYLDLQVWYNLSWIDPLSAGEDEAIKQILAKGRNFTEADKAAVVEKHREIMRRIIPKYKELAGKKQIELTTTPFYHPILPLLCDTDIAKTALPQLNLPFRFHRPEDAGAQVKKALEYFESKFGFRPEGMWPAEGSVSEAIIPVLGREGLKWIASDEDVLLHSLESYDKKENVLYRPWKLSGGGSELKIIFRSKELADLIGFVYSKWDEESAVNDFIAKLKAAAAASSIKDPLISVILDGENAWEYFRNNGLDFFRKLYARLSVEPEIQTVTVSEHLNKFSDTPALPRLYPGSWINHDFYIWIGHSEDQKAWEHLLRAREDAESWTEIKEKDPETFAAIMEELYIAEGSDWCWWYGDDHSSAQDEEFDLIFRSRLQKVYELAKKEAPPQLLSPILSSNKTIITQMSPEGFVNPLIDGKISNFYEWSSTCVYETGKASSAIHRAESIVRDVYFGYNLEYLFLRIDFNMLVSNVKMKDFLYEFTFINKQAFRLRFNIDSESKHCGYSFFTQSAEKDAWLETEEPGIRVAALKIAELAVPFKALKSVTKDNLNITLAVFKGENEVEKWPARGILNVVVPGDDFEAQNWQV
ncbi:MAG: glycoside hydrolase family 57 protein [Candidatus Firestonebacteria bacterium]